MSKEPELKTIGRLVEDLRAEFSNISVSKVRYLEEEGLVKPVRSTGGYRRFSAEDEQRIREILRLQNDQYLPLQVIKERLGKGLRRKPEHKNTEASSGNGATSPAKEPPSTPERLETGAELEPISWAAAARQAGFAQDQLDELEKYGIIRPDEHAEGKAISSPDMEILLLARDLHRFGLEPRHLRAFVSHAERQSALFGQILSPLLRRSRDRDRVREALEQLVAISDRMSNLLLGRELRSRFPF